MHRFNFFILPTQLCQRKWKENNNTSYAAQLLKQVLPIYIIEIVVYSSFIDYSFVVSPGVTFKCQVHMYSNTKGSNNTYNKVAELLCNYLLIVINKLTINLKTISLAFTKINLIWKCTNCNLGIAYFLLSIKRIMCSL